MKYFNRELSKVVKKYFLVNVLINIPILLFVSLIIINKSFFEFNDIVFVISIFFIVLIILFSTCFYVLKEFIYCKSRNTILVYCFG